MIGFISKHFKVNCCIKKNVFWPAINFFSTEMKEQQINLDGYMINYLKVGTGKKNILCFPGALGSIWNDFKPQIEHLDKTKFTIVAWDPPGYGQSRPPLRKFTSNFYHDDAFMAYSFMKALDIHTYSLLGWSDGGISSMIMAAQYPQSVESLIIWGSNAYITNKDIEIYESIKQIDKWSEKMRKPMIDLYGTEYFRNMWHDWCDILKLIFVNNEGNICKELLPQIQCPTFIIHGAKDPMIAEEHTNYLLRNIKGSSLHVFPEGKHNIHLRYADEFNKIVTDFLMNEK